MSLITSKPVFANPYNKGADQSVHPCSLISALVLHYLDLLSISKISNLVQVSVAAQTAKLVLFLVQNPKDRFSGNEVTVMILSFRTYRGKQCRPR